MIRAFLALLFGFALLWARPYNEVQLQRIAAYKQKIPFSFVVMGDNREGNDILWRIIKRFERSDILFAINNGDLTDNGGTEEFLDYIEILKHSSKPILSNIGNHEIPFFFGDKSNYKHFIGKPHYSFAYANSYFIFVDNANKKRVSKKQMKWLEKELRKSQRYKYRFVFMHVPLFDPREGKMWHPHAMKDNKNAQELNALFDKYDVTMLFASHIHTYLKGRWGKTPYIISGGAGAPNDKDGGFYHYIVVRVGEDGVEYTLKRL